MKHYNYITVKEAAQRWEISPRRVQVLCNEDRIEGAERIGHIWVIPEDTQKPQDRREKTGAYKNFRKTILKSYLQKIS